MSASLTSWDIKFRVFGKRVTGGGASDSRSSIIKIHWELTTHHLLERCVSIGTYRFFRCIDEIHRKKGRKSQHSVAREQQFSHYLAVSIIILHKMVLLINDPRDFVRSNWNPSEFFHLRITGTLVNVNSKLSDKSWAKHRGKRDETWSSSRVMIPRACSY